MTCSGHQKVTVMVLKVDLQCSQCYKKVKKILGKFPQIRDQIYDEKQNTVNITVVCCSPERIRNKLCSKGRKTIKSIEIKNPAPKNPAPAPAPAPIPDKSQMKKNEPTSKPAPALNAAPARQQTPVREPVAQWIPGYPPYPPPQMYPVSVVCCGPCYEGRHGGGPCYHGGSGYGYGYGYGPDPGYYSNRSDYFTDNNPTACFIM
ncbi:hypothetical protein KSS87_023452 [Heliosperma pusillum]|nr:hypothetical protein KSS87_023452 [Heliosperma pusillum]